jgi:quercetin dioxygenase-like cupin family protein
MKSHKLDDFYRGWFIGNFDPSVLKTDNFEVGLLTHKQGEHWPKHYHAIATEYNLLVSGKMIIKETTIEPGDIFIIEPNEIADPIFLEDCKVLCIKTPSVPGDKYEPI